MKIKHQLTAILMLLSALIFSACGGCGSYMGGGGGKTQAGITELSAAISNETITIAWKDPESVFDHIEIVWLPDGATAQNVAAGVQTYKAESLVNGTNYTFTARSIDAASTVTSEATVMAKPGIPVYTDEDMNNVRNDLTGYYILMADISLSGYSSGEGWEPIGNDTTSFTGTFDGNGYVISGVVIDRAAENQGLLGNIGADAIVKDLRLADCEVNGTSYIGALAGKNSGEIRNCSISGNVSGSVNYVGGLAGTNYNGIISRCRSAGNVSGTEEHVSTIGGLVGDSSGTIDYSSSSCTVSGYNSIGGLVGSQMLGVIINSYATGAVNGNAVAGGLAGFVMDAAVSNCYARGNVTAYEFAGGLIGDIYQLVDETLIISFCYATGAVSGDLDLGGLLAHIDEDAALNFCYYDRETTGMSDTGKGDPKYTAEMKQQSTFDDGVGDGTDDDWDFTTIWAIDTDISGGFINNGYPYLINNPPAD